MVRGEQHKTPAWKIRSMEKLFEKKILMVASIKESPFIIRKLPYYPFYDNPNYPQKFAHYPPSHPYYHVIIIGPKQKTFICTTNVLNYMYLYKVHWFAGCKLQHICIFSTCASLWRQLSFVVMQDERCFNVILL